MDMIVEVFDVFKEISDTLVGELKAYMAPYAEVLPDRRYAKTLMALVPGMLAAQTPQISGAAAQAPGRAASSWPLAKCGYSLMKTPRFSHEGWLQVLYDDARRTAQAAQVERVIVALDPVNFEQAYMEKLEGASVIWKSTPPGTLPQRQKRLTPGYPALLAYTTNLPKPAVPYARWFSYTEKGFRSENMEIFQALERISQVLAGFQVCIVADAGLDDRKFYDRCRHHELQFIVRAARDRLIDIFNPRLQRWEREHLVEIVSSMPCHVPHGVHPCGQDPLGPSHPGLVPLPHPRQRSRSVGGGC